MTKMETLIKKTEKEVTNGKTVCILLSDGRKVIIEKLNANKNSDGV